MNKDLASIEAFFRKVEDTAYPLFEGGAGPLRQETVAAASFAGILVEGGDYTAAMSRVVCLWIHAARPILVLGAGGDATISGVLRSAAESAWRLEAGGQAGEDVVNMLVGVGAALLLKAGVSTADPARCLEAAAQLIFTDARSAAREFSKPGDWVYISPRHAEGRPWARKSVGVAALVQGRQRDNNGGFPIFYYKVKIDGRDFLINVEDVQAEPVRPDWDT